MKTRKYVSKNPNNSKHSTYNVVRIVREEFMVDAANRNEAIDAAEDPHTVTVIRTTAKKA